MGVQPRPWFTTKSRFAIVFIAGTVGGFLLQTIIPVVISEREQILTEKIAESNREIESLSRRVEVTRLLFDHFFGKSVDEQRAVVTYLRYQFPDDIRRKSLQAILVRGAKRSVKSDITSSVASAEGIGKSKLDQAVKQERGGFLSLIQGDIEKARESFIVAYEVFPTYHNVDEISNRVLTEKRSMEYSRGTRDERRALLRSILSEILTVYSWGIPSDLLPGLRNKFDNLQ